MCQNCVREAARPENQQAWRAAPLGAVRGHALPLVRRYITARGGYAHDADDLLQDALVVYMDKLADNGFQLSVPGHVYVFSIARNLWRKQIRESARLSMAACLPEGIAEEAMEAAADVPTEERVHTWLGRITVRCQRLMFHLYALSASIEEVRTRLGYGTPHSVSAQKYKCLSMLKQEALR